MVPRLRLLGGGREAGRNALEDAERQKVLRIKLDDEAVWKRLAFKKHEVELTCERERAQAQGSIARDSAALRLRLQGEANAQAERFELNRRQAEMTHLGKQDRI